MAFRLPHSLQTPDDESAVKWLRLYYGPAFGEDGFYTGAAFDTWDSTGTRSRDANVFTADDLIAITFLSGRVEAWATCLLLNERRSEFAELLKKVGPDHDLADEPDTLGEEWPSSDLYRELRGLPDVGPAVASKLVARKRPQLFPAYDSVVSKVLGTKIDHWEAIRVALRAEDCALHRRLLSLRKKAGLPGAVSALRLLEVITWMEGTEADMRIEDLDSLA